MTTQRPRDTGLAVTLALTGIPAAVGVMCLSPVLPLIEAGYADRPEVLPLVKYVSVSIGLGMVIGAPLAGAVSDRVGRRITLLVATIAFCLLGTAGYFINHLPTLIALRTLAGAGAAAIMTTGVALIGEHFEQDRRDRLIGINAMCSSLAAIVTIWLSGALGAESPKSPFLLHMLPLPLVLLALANVPGKAPVRQAIGAVSERLSSTHWHTFGFALASGAVIFSIPVYLPFFMRDAGHVDPILNAMILAFMSICSAGFAAIYGLARTRLSIGSAFVTCLSLFVSGCLVLLFSSRVEAFVLAAILLGFGMSWVAPNLMTAANLLSKPGNRGRIVGLVKGANLSGSFVAVLLLDPLYRSMGASSTIAVIAFFAAILAIVSALLLRHLGKAPLK